MSYNVVVVFPPSGKRAAILTRALVSVVVSPSARYTSCRRIRLMHHCGDSSSNFYIGTSEYYNNHDRSCVYDDNNILF